MKLSEAPIQVELLYIPNCPSYNQVWNELAEVIADGNLDMGVGLVRMDTQEEAGAYHFAGLPTVLVDEHDLEGYEGQGGRAERCSERSSLAAKGLV
jgi:hypothetical protein